MEHLALEIFDLNTADGKKATTSKYAYLPEDASITITDTSEIFENGDVWSHSFTLNVHANAHIFGTSGEIHGSRLHEQINKRRARLWVEGLPLYLGYLKLDDEVEVDEDGNVDVTFESGQKTFDDLIEGAKANQVPLMNDVLIGMALWRQREVDLRLNVRVTATIKEGAQYDVGGRVTTGQTIVFPSSSSYETIDVSSKDIGVCSQYPRMVFPKGVFANQKGSTPAGGVKVSQLNTDTPYDDGHPYCNIALCYQKHGYPTENGATNYSAEEQALRGYETAPANRVNSAPNFYVLYWLKCLMKHIGINIMENQMMDVEDLRRLFFVNTNCAYEEPTEFDRTGSTVSSRYGCFTTYGDNDYIAEKFEGTVDVPNSKLNAESWTWESYNSSTGTYGPTADWDSAVKMEVNVVGQINYTDADKANYVSKNRRYHYAYATSECFPDVDVSEVIKAIENGFGVRFLFDSSYKRVRIVLLRNIFRDEDVQEIPCDIISDVKQENCIRGFRLTYGDKKDDTTFYYKGFADKMAKANELWADDTDKHDYSHWDLNADYGKLITQISAFDKTCYVTPNNGNAYGIKIDQDAKAYEELHPSLFEYAGYMDAEDGDCTGEAATIEQIDMGFTPAIVNDVNFETEKDYGTTDQQFALFVSEEMRSRRPDPGDKAAPASYNDSDAVYDISKIDSEKQKLGLFSINSDMPVRKTITGEKRGVNLAHDGKSYNLRFRYSLLAAGYINEGYRLYLQDNYEPNDNGISPLETHDWGLMFGIMRGSGSDAHVAYFDDPDDGEDNQTWEIVPGSGSIAHPDTCDSYGKEWDYNGSIHVSTKTEAETEIRSRYPSTANNILRERWPIEVQSLRDAGWTVSGDMTRKANYFYYKLTINSPSAGYVNVYATPIVISSTRSYTGPTVYTQAEMKEYIISLWNQYKFDLVDYDERHLVMAVNPTDWSTLAYLRGIYFGYVSSRDLDNGLGITDGRFSLKLRAEKPNPYFNASQAESDSNRRYLKITNENLQRRGLADQFYKEYSYWVRNARIVKRTVRMELVQLLAIDKTKRVTVGDVTGFIRKMQYSVSGKTGLGNVTLEIMYI